MHTSSPGWRSSDTSRRLCVHAPRKRIGCMENATMRQLAPGRKLDRASAGPIFMVRWVAMKTTLEIPDELFRRTKAEAALRGQSMKELVIEALDDKLRRRPKTDGGWRRVFGRATRAMVREVDARLKDLERVDAEE